MIIVMIYDMIDYTSQIVITSTDFSDRFLINFCWIVPAAKFDFHILLVFASIIAIITTIVIVIICSVTIYFHYHYYDHNTYTYNHIYIYTYILTSVFLSKEY